jgi:hypothetical protein
MWLFASQQNENLVAAPSQAEEEVVVKGARLAINKEAACRDRRAVKVARRCRPTSSLTQLKPADMLVKCHSAQASFT